MIDEEEFKKRYIEYKDGMKIVRLDKINAKLEELFKENGWDGKKQL